MKRSITVLLSLAALVLFGCLTTGDPDAAEDPAAARAALSAAADKWGASMDAKDSAAIAAVYAADAKIYPPNVPPRSGSDIQGEWQALIDTGLDVELQIESVEASGHLGYRTGKYKLTDPEGNTADEGHFIEVWHHSEEGGWVMAHDIWNSDLPLPECGEADAE